MHPNAQCKSNSAAVGWENPCAFPAEPFELQLSLKWQHSCTGTQQVLWVWVTRPDLARLSPGKYLKNQPQYHWAEWNRSKWHMSFGCLQMSCVPCLKLFSGSQCMQEQRAEPWWSTVRYRTGPSSAGSSDYYKFWLPECHIHLPGSSSPAQRATVSWLWRGLQQGHRLHTCTGVK